MLFLELFEFCSSTCRHLNLQKVFSGRYSENRMSFTIIYPTMGNADVTVTNFTACKTVIMFNACKTGGPFRVVWREMCLILCFFWGLSLSAMGHDGVKCILYCGFLGPCPSAMGQDDVKCVLYCGFFGGLSLCLPWAMMV